MRIKNLELRKCKGINKKFEIVKWETNENIPSCYVLYFINNGEIAFVGDRPLNLENIQEYKDSLFLLRKAVKKSTKYQIDKNLNK